MSTPDNPLNPLDKPLATSQLAKKRRQELIQEREKTSFSRYFTSVGYGLLTMFTAYPLLRVKTLIQCKTEIAEAGRHAFYQSYWSTFKHIWKNEGKLKTFRGIAPYFAFSLPFILAKQSAVGAFSHDLDSSVSPINAFVRGFAATSVGALTATIFTPFLMGATKLMTDQRLDKRAIFEYPGPINAMRRVSTISGRRALWTGALPFWLQHTTYFSALFSTSLLLNAIGIANDHPVLATITSSAIAMLAAQPFDVVRSRMQYRVHTQVIDYVPQYNGMVDCFSQIIRKEGLPALWRGGCGAFGIYLISTMWFIISTARGHKNKDKDLKNEHLLQKRLERSAQHRDRFRRDRVEDANLYGEFSSDDLKI